eukprot:m.167296 g.167296  ORF g.167296 m.167296 type:complete len:63 (+) comp53163_c0_seq3:996-1184(+)
MDGTAQPFVPSHARSWSAPSSGGQSPLFPPFYNGYKSPDLPGLYLPVPFRCPCDSCLHLIKR